MITHGDVETPVKEMVVTHSKGLYQNSKTGKLSFVLN